MVDRKGGTSMKILDFKVVRFNTLKNAELFQDSFSSVSYGDAVFTLVGPGQLIAELKDMKDKSLAPLVKELEQVPAGVYVALDG
jgi:hypothetical protein